MNRAASLLLLLISILASAAEAAEGRFPWKFDMTPAEVRAQEGFGPYRAFSNGDLETYNGLFNGRKENFQFFFTEDRLRRIGVYLYEGTDINAAASKWLELYDVLARDFGSIEVPGNSAPDASDSATRKAFVVNATDTVLSVTKTQMAPYAQSPDAFVFSSFWRDDLGGQRTYYVVLYFDRPPNKSLERTREK